MAKMHKPTSPYYNTPVRDFYLDLARFRVIEPAASDRRVTIEPRYENRPDLFANDYYGSPNLWWVMALRNMDVLIDPIEDFRAGLEIWLPSEQTLGFEVI